MTDRQKPDHRQQRQPYHALVPERQQLPTLGGLPRASAVAPSIAAASRASTDAGGRSITAVPRVDAAVYPLYDAAAVPRADAAVSQPYFAMVPPAPPSYPLYDAAAVPRGVPRADAAVSQPYFVMVRPAADAYPPIHTPVSFPPTVWKLEEKIQYSIPGFGPVATKGHDSLLPEENLAVMASCYHAEIQQDIDPLGRYLATSSGDLRHLPLVTQGPTENAGAKASGFTCVTIVQPGMRDAVTVNIKRKGFRFRKVISLEHNCLQRFRDRFMLLTLKDRTHLCILIGSLISSQVKSWLDKGQPSGPSVPNEEDGSLVFDDEADGGEVFADEEDKGELPGRTKTDCNDNGVADLRDITGPTSPDVNNNNNNNNVRHKCESSIIHVRSGASGANDGSCWNDAFVSLQDGLAAAAAVASDDYFVEVWVASGEYRPDEGRGITPGDRDATFLLLNGVGVYGGFAGSEIRRTDRQDFTLNPTVLSGEIGAQGAKSDNSRHVVTGSGLGPSAILDGFFVRSGHNEDGAGGGVLIPTGGPTVRVSEERNGGFLEDGGGTDVRHGRSSLRWVVPDFLDNLRFPEDGASDVSRAPLASGSAATYVNTSGEQPNKSTSVPRKEVDNLRFPEDGASDVSRAPLAGGSATTYVNTSGEQPNKSTSVPRKEVPPPKEGVQLDWEKTVQESTSSDDEEADQAALEEAAREAATAKAAAEAAAAEAERKAAKMEMLRKRAEEAMARRQANKKAKKEE